MDMQNVGDFVGYSTAPPPPLTEGTYAERMRATLKAATTRKVTYVTILVAAAFVRCWLMVSDQSVIYADEIHQTLEQAHRFAFGYGLRPWEFYDGARSWLFPGTLGILFKIAGWLHVDSGRTLVFIAKASMQWLGLCGVYATMRLAERLSVGREKYAAVVVAGTIAAFFPISLVFGHRCLSESVSAPALVIAALFTTYEQRRRIWAAGLIVAAAVFCRYQNGLGLIALLGALLWARRWDAAKHFTYAAALGGVLGGCLDWATWGYPFHSFVAYVNFNLVRGQAASIFGTEPFYYYFVMSWRSLLWVLPVVLVGALAAVDRAPALFGLIAAYVLVHAAVAHKEFRFVFPVFPVLIALCGTGFARVGMRFGLRKGFWMPCLLFIPAMLIRVRDMTYDSIGYFGRTERDASEYANTELLHENEEPGLAFWEAGARKDLCGIMLYGDITFVGSTTYLHRNVPLYEGPDEDLMPYVNYIVANQKHDVPSEYSEMKTIGETVLYRRDGGCEPDAPKKERWPFAPFPK